MNFKTQLSELLVNFGPHIPSLNLTKERISVLNLFERKLYRLPLLQKKKLTFTDPKTHCISVSNTSVLTKFGKNYNVELMY